MTQNRSDRNTQGANLGKGSGSWRVRSYRRGCTHRSQKTQEPLLEWCETAFKFVIHRFSQKSLSRECVHMHSFETINWKNGGERFAWGPFCPSSPLRTFDEIELVSQDVHRISLEAKFHDYKFGITRTVKQNPQSSMTKIVMLVCNRCIHSYQHRLRRILSGSGLQFLGVFRSQWSRKEVGNKLDKKWFRKPTDRKRIIELAEISSTRKRRILIALLQREGGLLDPSHLLRLTQPICIVQLNESEILIQFCTSRSIRRYQSQWELQKNSDQQEHTVRSQTRRSFFVPPTISSFGVSRVSIEVV